MGLGSKAAISALLSCVLFTPVHAQIVMQRNVSLELARAIADAAMESCRAAGYNTSVAVVDRAGDTVLLMRGTNATPQTAEMARRKAYTARMWRRSSQQWAEETAGDAARMPQRDLADVIALSGGIPISVGDDTFGGIGSAGSTLEQDHLCAQAGIDAVADQLQ